MKKILWICNPGSADYCLYPLYCVNEHKKFSVLLRIRVQLHVKDPSLVDPKYPLYTLSLLPCKGGCLCCHAYSWCDLEW